MLEPYGAGDCLRRLECQLWVSFSACTGLTLNELGSTLSGSAQTYTAFYNVTGTYDRPHVTLVLVPAGKAGTTANTIRYDGTASGGTMTLHTEGSNPETVVYQRGAVAFPGGGTDIAR